MAFSLPERVNPIPVIPFSGVGWLKAVSVRPGTALVPANSLCRWQIRRRMRPGKKSKLQMGLPIRKPHFY